MRIHASTWTRRLWTFQESALAERVSFRFGDGVVDGDALYEQYWLHDRGNPLTVGLDQLSKATRNTEHQRSLVRSILLLPDEAEFASYTVGTGEGMIGSEESSDSESIPRDDADAVYSLQSNGSSDAETTSSSSSEESGKDTSSDLAEGMSFQNVESRVKIAELEQLAIESKARTAAMKAQTMSLEARTREGYRWMPTSFLGLRLNGSCSYDIGDGFRLADGLLLKSSGFFLKDKEKLPSGRLVVLLSDYYYQISLYSDGKTRDPDECAGEDGGRFAVVVQHSNVKYGSIYVVVLSITRIANTVIYGRLNARTSLRRLRRHDLTQTNSLVSWTPADQKWCIG